MYTHSLLYMDTWPTLCVHILLCVHIVYSMWTLGVHYVYTAYCMCILSLHYLDSAVYEQSIVSSIINSIYAVQYTNINSIYAVYIVYYDLINKNKIKSMYILSSFL